MLTDPQNCDSKFQAVNQTRSKIKFEYPEAGSWSTVSQEQFSLKIPEETPMGIRKKLLLKFLTLQASKRAFEKVAGDPCKTSYPVSTEYRSHFRNESFVPFLENDSINEQKLLENSIYRGEVKTLHKELFDKKCSNVPKKLKPFARSSTFTTPTELVLNEQIEEFQ